MFELLIGCSSLDTNSKHKLGGQSEEFQSSVLLFCFHWRQDAIGFTSRFIRISEIGQRFQHYLENSHSKGFSKTIFPGLQYPQQLSSCRLGLPERTHDSNANCKLACMFMQNTAPLTSRWESACSELSVFSID